ncbi:Sec-independent protein translocase subunit TatA [Brevibacterium casei]|uniref:Sec-independent protein translocase subunit TatA n=1 Tax=Brevibacterium casei TaxID=33889 RepID=UPI0021AFFC3A|nr:Sec-independent protein translocase subunit TatA [Brevibacterium casei]MCT1447617.1 Sec-independent protein translocase subunit TatA [Brevibacterium casei]
MNLSPMHIAVVVIVIILIFGAPKLPMLARSLGQSLKIFKSEVKDLRDDKDEKTTEPGELGRDAGQSTPPSAPDAAQPAAHRNQDPQPREK